MPALMFAGELKVTVTDRELDFPLEGAKVSLQSKQSVKAETDEDGNAVLTIPDNVTSGTI